VKAAGSLEVFVPCLSGYIATYPRRQQFSSDGISVSRHYLEQQEQCGDQLNYVTNIHFYNNFQILNKVNYHALMKAMIHIPAIFCRWIIIILQLWQNFCSCNTHCVRNIKINRKETLKELKELHSIVVLFVLSRTAEKHVTVVSSPESNNKAKTNRNPSMSHHNYHMGGGNKKGQLL
jgi:hypothetical protein